MTSSTTLTHNVGPAAPAAAAAAAHVRRRLGDAGVIALSLCGGPGAGKTALLEQMLRRLRGDFSVGVMVGNPKAERDIRRLHPVAEFVSHVRAGGLEATHVRDELDHAHIDHLDVLFIETATELAGSAPPDLGQDLRIAVFSVAGGDDQVAAFPCRVAAADLVLLNKMDLLPHVMFNPHVFRADVRRINSAVPVLEASAARVDGLDQWERWLRDAIARRRPARSAQSFRPTETFLG